MQYSSPGHFVCSPHSPSTGSPGAIVGSFAVVPPVPIAGGITIMPLLPPVPMTTGGGAAEPAIA